MKPLFRLAIVIWILILTSMVPSIFADDTTYSDTGTTSDSSVMDKFTPIYDEVMWQYDIGSRVSIIGPSALLGRLYVAASSGSSEYAVERMQISLLYDRVLAGRAVLSSWEAAPFEQNMPDAQAYERVWTRLDTEKRALEQYPFVRTFRQEYDVSAAVRKALAKVDVYFAEEHEVAATEKIIAGVETRLRNNPLKDPVRLVTLFVIKEYMRMRLDIAKHSPQEGLAPDQAEGE